MTLPAIPSSQPALFDNRSTVRRLSDTDYRVGVTEVLSWLRRSEAQRAEIVGFVLAETARRFGLQSVDYKNQFEAVQKITKVTDRTLARWREKEQATAFVPDTMSGSISAKSADPISEISAGDGSGSAAVEPSPAEPEVVEAEPEALIAPSPGVIGLGSTTPSPGLAATPPGEGDPAPARPKREASKGSVTAPQGPPAGALVLPSFPMRKDIRAMYLYLTAHGEPVHQGVHDDSPDLARLLFTQLGNVINAKSAKVVNGGSGSLARADVQTFQKREAGTR